MSIWRPDPTFYASPKMAMDAPAEKLAYVASWRAKKDVAMAASLKLFGNLTTGEGGTTAAGDHGVLMRSHRY